jgi:hypothetical protein
MAHRIRKRSHTRNLSSKALPVLDTPGGGTDHANWHSNNIYADKGAQDSDGKREQQCQFFNAFYDFVTVGGGSARVKL